MGRLKRPTGDRNIMRFLFPLAPALIISVAVSWADYRLADTARTAAITIHKAYANRSERPMV